MAKRKRHSTVYQTNECLKNRTLILKFVFIIKGPKTKIKEAKNKMNESEMNSLQLKKYLELRNAIGNNVELTKFEKKH